MLLLPRDIGRLENLLGYNIMHAASNRDGVDETNVSNCRQVDDEVSSSSSSGGSGDMGGYLALGAIVFGLWLIIEYWWIVIPVAVIGGIGWFLKD